MIFFQLIRITLSLLGDPTSEMVLSRYPAMLECRQAIRELPQSEKRPGVRFECRPKVGK